MCRCHFFHPDRAGLEFSRAGTWIGRIDGQNVGVHFVLKMERHEYKPRPQAVAQAYGSFDGSARRDNTHRLAINDTQTGGILWRKIERFSTP